MTDDELNHTIEGNQSMNCRLTTEYQRRDVDVVIMENETIRVEILAGKGGDITEIRDKRTGHCLVKPV